MDKFMRGLPPKARALLLAIQVTDGGPGSGNFNHSGRPGLVGGSGEGGGSGGKLSGTLSGKQLVSKVKDMPNLWTQALKKVPFPVEDDMYDLIEDRGWEKRVEKDLGETTMSLESLVMPQPAVYTRSLIEMAQDGDGYDESKAGAISVLKIKDKYVIVDGKNRATLAKLSGADSIKVHLYSASDKDTISTESESESESGSSEENPPSNSESGSSGENLLTGLPDIKSPEYQELFKKSRDYDNQQKFVDCHNGIREPFKPTEIMNETRKKLGLEPYEEYAGDDPDDIQAAYDYTYQGDGRMNKLLRQSSLETYESEEWNGQLDKTREQIGRLDRLMELPENATKEPGIVFRGYDSSDAILKSMGVSLKNRIGASSLSTLRKALIGHTFSDPGFVSTAMDMEGVMQHNEDFVMSIYCPAGTQGLNLHFVSHYRKEYEFLLHRGSQFVVTGVSVEDIANSSHRGRAQTVIHVALVSQNPSDIPTDYAK